MKPNKPLFDTFKRPSWTLFVFPFQDLVKEILKAFDTFGHKLLGTVTWLDIQSKGSKFLKKSILKGFSGFKG